MLQLRTSHLMRMLMIPLLCTMLQCKQAPGEEKGASASADSSLPSDLLLSPPEGSPAPDGMVWIPGGEFMQGAVQGDQHAMAHERPAHKVVIDGFFMDVHEVTNKQFAAFVAETGYVTVAERPLEWEELKKQLPEGTPKPADSVLQPGSLVFKKATEMVPNLYDFSQWWSWKIGASWKAPHGPGTNIEGKENEPVVHISYEDALAYCEWAGRSLPTEAQWEYAARAGREGALYSWGDDENVLPEMANSWDGQFPVTNSGADGYEGVAPVMEYPPNAFGLYDMAGNVWEWTTDWYNVKYYETVSGKEALRNPEGASQSFVPGNPYAKERVIKGGSFLCNASYCASYRISSRMGSSMDSGLEHLGFRTVLPVREQAHLP